MRFCYTALFVLILPLILFRLWRKGRNLPAYRDRWHERLGKAPKLSGVKKTLWFHTVSVGEFIAARPLIQHYLTREDVQVLVTCTTPTGSEQIRSSFQDRVAHCYLPYDIPVLLNRFLNLTRAEVFICLETELWPNLIAACKQRNIPIVIANARLSLKSASGYAKFASLTKSMLEGVNIAAIQNEVDAGRFIDLGLAKEKARCIGNIKFDLDIPDTLLLRSRELKAALFSKQNTKLWIAASTHSGEDEIILETFASLQEAFPELKLLIVPRHPERFNSVYELCRSRNFATARRSKHIEDNSLAPFEVMVGDTMGELLLLFAVSDFAFVGGSLVDNGGHNYIEPAALGLPLFSGSSTYNFRETAEELVRENALILADSATELAAEIQKLLTDTARFAQMGSNAKRVAEKNRGALARLIHIIDDFV